MRIVLFLLLTMNLYSQTLTKSSVNLYVKNVDSLKVIGKLNKYFYPNMSYCGGALYGFYNKDKLVLMEATHGGEFDNFISYKIYLKDSLVYKIVFRQHIAEDDKYGKKYPKDEQIDEKKLTYSDTTYTVLMTGKLIFIKSSRGKIVSKVPNEILIERWLDCARKMQSELASEKVIK